MPRVQFLFLPNRWYACQFIQLAVGGRCTQDFRPIYVRQIARRPPGLQVEFRDVVPPSGLREMSCDLTVMIWTSSFLFANVLGSEGKHPGRFLLISHITSEWLEQCAAQMIAANPPEAHGLTSTAKVEDYLDRVFRTRG